MPLPFNAWHKVWLIFLLLQFSSPSSRLSLDEEDPRRGTPDSTFPFLSTVLVDSLCWRLLWSSRLVLLERILPISFG
jgi:hypothetical protein